MGKIRIVAYGLVVAFWTIAATPLQAGGGVTGHARFERIKGKPSMGYAELYESNLFLSPAGSPPTGPVRRLGAPPSAPITYDGYYLIDNMPAGMYSILVDQPVFFITPVVVPNVTIQDGVTITVNPELPVDYSTYFKNSGEWTPPDVNWYQTFTATGAAVRGIAFSVAGSPAPQADVALLKDNGNPDVRNWQLIATRREDSVGQDTDNWVRFRSADAPLIPGVHYAVRLTALITGTLQPYKRNKDANSYVGGRAYNGNGIAQNYDLNVTVFADNDGTRVTMNKRTAGLGALLDGNFASRWGQTFTATGTSLAAVDVWAAGANYEWDIDYRWQIRQGGPTGTIISPVKTTKAAYQSFGTGLHGVSYRANEVLLTVGQVYFVEFIAMNPPADSPGFNPFIMDDDSYAGGESYQWNGSSYDIHPADDVNMTIVEYAPINPTIRVLPATLTHTVYLGDSLPSDTFSVTNIGMGTINYTITAPPAWLSVNPTSGASSGESDTITVNYDVAGLPVGNYSTNITISAPEAVNSPVVLPVTVNVVSVGPDFDGDGDVDMTDFASFQRCLSGSGILLQSGCTWADFQHNGDVDQNDLAIFLNCLAGADIPANHACEN